MAGNTPISDVPDAPTIGTATGGTESATVTYTAAATGGAVTTFTATSTPGSLTGTGASPITVSGLTGGTAYTFTVSGANSTGTSPASAASNSVTPTAAITPRALFAGGWNGSATVNTVDYVNFASVGNATDFGDLSSTSVSTVGVGSSTRGVFAIGGTLNTGNNYVNTIDYFTIASTGNATDFGDLTLARGGGAGMASSTRGVFSAGSSGNGGATMSQVIDYITIATTGNATNFGNMTISGGASGVAGLSSPTRGVEASASINGGSNYSNFIDYITIATTGDAIDFGDLTSVRSSSGGGASSTRGIFAAGILANGTRLATSDYITIATTGNGTVFGDLTRVVFAIAGTSNSTLAMLSGGQGDGATLYNVIDTFTIASTGNATDFGDLSVARTGHSSCSNSHGGL
jgi:hypothetical protein